MSRTKRAPAAEGLGAERMLEMYRLMLLSRRIDDEEMKLKRKNLYYFQISGAGHEAPLVAAGLHLKAGHDWFYTYYRDRALLLALGVTPYAMFLEGVGSVEDPASAGRQMPSHWGDWEKNIVTSSSPTGTQMLHAVGGAEVGRYHTLVRELRDKREAYATDEVIYVSIGEGSTSEGEFWEALSSICTLQLPVLVHVEDNGYAISVPVEVNTPGGDISPLARGFPGLTVIDVDGTDMVASYEAMGRAVEHIRGRKGPVLVHSRVTRPYAHSMSDDQKHYRPPEEREEEAATDAIKRFETFLIEEKIATRERVKEIQEKVNEEILAASDRAVEAPKPDPKDAMLHVYSQVDPSSSAFDTKPEEGDVVSMVELINLCLRDEMRRDPRIVVFGEDVADASREEILERVPGKGGVFKVTHGLQREFGGHRVFNSPLAEANIVGRATGWALRGMKPVVEIQFFDYIWPAMMQLRNELAMIRWRSGGHWKAPAVIRVPIGGYLTGGGPYHSQNGEVLFTHCPGLRVVFPSNALDANGLLRTAIRSDDPVLFLEHKHLYRQPYAKGAYPGPNYMIPFGRARLEREGTDLTIVTYGALVRRSSMAAQRAAEDGISVEILDLRTVAPWDKEAVYHSVRKTGRVLVAHEDAISFGYGAEIAARITEDCFEYLDAPVRRIGALDVPVAYSPILEDAILPQIEGIEAAIRDLAKY